MRFLIVFLLLFTTTVFALERNIIVNRDSDASETAIDITPLGIAGIHSTPVIEVERYKNIFVLINSDVGSATDGVVVKQSYDRECDLPINWDEESKTTYNTANKDTFKVEVHGLCLQIDYTNGGTAQTHFRFRVTAEPLL